MELDCLKKFTKALDFFPPMGMFSLASSNGSFG